jgi:tetratricopeptide (TPR) repeat protein
VDFRTEKCPLDVLCPLVDLLFLSERGEASIWRLNRLHRILGFLPAGSPGKGAGGIFARCAAALRMVALLECNEREVPPRSSSNLAFFSDGGRNQPDHDLVSKSRHWRGRDRYWINRPAAGECGDGGMVVRVEDFRPRAVDVDLPAVALRFSGAARMVAFDCTSCAGGASVAVAGSWDPGRFFAVAYFVVALLPVLGLVRMAYLRSGTIVADHLQYFACVSLIALFSAGIATFWAPQRGIKVATVALVALLLGAMGTYTCLRAAVFRDEEMLWRDNLSKNPDSWQAHVRMGQRLFKQERYTEALTHLQRVVQLKPELADNHNLLGLIYCRLRRFEEGIAEYREALQLKEAKSFGAASNSVATIRTNLANALAITASNLSGSNPTMPEAAMKRYEEAIEQYERALELEPRQRAIHRNLGMLLARIGRYDEAEAQLRATLEIVPNEPAARAALEEIEAKRR